MGTNAPSGTRMKWEGRWDQLVGNVRKMWGNVTDDDVTKAEGDYQRLIGLVKEKSGETQEEIERRLEEL